MPFPRQYLNQLVFQSLVLNIINHYHEFREIWRYRELFLHYAQGSQVTCLLRPSTVVQIGILAGRLQGVMRITWAFLDRLRPLAPLSCMRLNLIVRSSPRSALIIKIVNNLSSHSSLIRSRRVVDFSRWHHSNGQHCPNIRRQLAISQLRKLDRPAN